MLDRSKHEHMYLERVDEGVRCRFDWGFYGVKCYSEFVVDEDRVDQLADEVGKLREIGKGDSKSYMRAFSKMQREGVGEQVIRGLSEALDRKLWMAATLMAGAALCGYCVRESEPESTQRFLYLFGTMFVGIEAVKHGIQTFIYGRMAKNILDNVNKRNV